jgi:hypothetical protein
MCRLGLEATGRAWEPGQARPGHVLSLGAPGLGLVFCKPEAVAQAMARWLYSHQKKKESLHALGSQPDMECETDQFEELYHSLSQATAVESGGLP